MFCKPGDAKRPGVVPSIPNDAKQICPDDLSADADEVTDTVPIGWYIRIQFDELLDPSVEELLPIPDKNGNPTDLSMGSLAATQPVAITCGGVNVPYDGYYNPSGNSVTWPVGPSLFIAPGDTTMIAPGTECEISLKPDVVTDKDGELVPAAQLGPYKFKIAELALLKTSPAALDSTKPPPATPTKLDASAPLVVTFNALIDPTTLPPTAVTMQRVADCKGTALDPVPVTTPLTKLDPKDKTSIDISDGEGPPNPTTANPANHDAWVHGATYLITLVAGTVIKGVAGGMHTLEAPDKLTICFQTAM